MRDEWKNGIVASQAQPAARNGYGGAGNAAATTANSRSSQGLTRVGRLNELDRGASLNLAARAMKLKMKTTKGFDVRQREVSERRQVGDAESVINAPEQSTGGGTPWWRNVGMEEGM